MAVAWMIEFMMTGFAKTGSERSRAVEGIWKNQGLRPFYTDDFSKNGVLDLKSTVKSDRDMRCEYAENQMQREENRRVD